MPVASVSDQAHILKFDVAEEIWWSVCLGGV
jgi:hypothetical protein